MKMMMSDYEVDGVLPPLPASARGLGPDEQPDEQPGEGSGA